MGGLPIIRVYPQLWRYTGSTPLPTIGHHGRYTAMVRGCIPALSEYPIIDICLVTATAWGLGCPRHLPGLVKHHLARFDKRE